MQYPNIERPTAAYARINWTQALITFAACLCACLLAVGVFIAIQQFFLNRKRQKDNGYPNQTPIRNYQAQNHPQEVNHRHAEENHETENHRDEEENRETENDSDKAQNSKSEKVKDRPRLNGKFIKVTTPTQP